MQVPPELFSSPGLQGNPEVELAGHSLLQCAVLNTGPTYGATSPWAQEELLHFKSQVINLGLQGCGAGWRHGTFHRALDRHGMKR